MRTEMYLHLRENAESLPASEYKRGYCLGLARQHEGPGGPTDDEHDEYLRAALAGRRDFERGYRDALALRPANPQSRAAVLSTGGRPSKLGVESERIWARVTGAEREVFERLGGAAWLRQMLQQHAPA